MITPPTPVDAAGVAHHYDELDPFYRDLWGEHVHHGLWQTGRETTGEAVHQLIHHLAAVLDLRSGDRVCDVGCGYGGTARLLASAYGAQVTGVTISPAQHAYASAQPAPTPAPTYRLGDWLANDLPDATFDAVLAVESLAHMADKPRALAEIRRVLRPGGRFGAYVWLAAPDVPLWAERLLLTPICTEGRLPSLPTASHYRRWMADAALGSTAFADLSRAVRPTWSHILMRVASRLVRDRRYRAYLLRPTHRERRFLLTVARIWLAYRLGVMRYGLITGRAV